MNAKLHGGMSDVDSNPSRLVVLASALPKRVPLPGANRSRSGRWSKGTTTGPENAQGNPGRRLTRRSGAQR
eukprot:11841256-Alexandrium_andersonii.AAC.1